MEILRTLGLEADNMIGHSIGELACSYADSSLTLEEAILAAYYRGLVTKETEFIRAGMAAVGTFHNILGSLRKHPNENRYKLVTYQVSSSLPASSMF